MKLILSMIIVVGLLSVASTQSQNLVTQSSYNTYTAVDSLETPVPTEDSGEVKWSAYLATTGDTRGIAEYRLSDGSRIDILTESTAWEVDWDDKWAEAIGQSLFYWLSTDNDQKRNPGIVLLRRTSSDEYYLRCLSVVRELRNHGIEMNLKVQPVKSGR